VVGRTFLTTDAAPPTATIGAPVCVLTKVGEASLKGRNRRRFLDALRRNLKAALAGLDARIETGGSVLVIAVGDEVAADEVASRLERVFGFAAASVCLRCERDVEQIADVAMLAFERRRPETFAIRVRRRDKTFPLTSQDLERLLGAAIQQRTGLPVDLSNPDLELRVELDLAGAYVHVRELDTAGGLPVGTSGRALSLLSGGIDSPVASLLGMKRGLSLDYVHFSGEPYLEPKATAKAQAQAKVLNGFQAERPGVMWVVPFGQQQRMLSAVSDESHRIVLYRRQMARIGCALAEPGLLADARQHERRRRRIRASDPSAAAVVRQARSDGQGRRDRHPRALGAGSRRRLSVVRGRQAADRGAACRHPGGGSAA
jgi:thiamine biosynthesis protein ThiI